MGESPDLHHRRLLMHADSYSFVAMLATAIITIDDIYIYIHIYIYIYVYIYIYIYIYIYFDIQIQIGTPHL